MQKKHLFQPVRTFTRIVYCCALGAATAGFIFSCTSDNEEDLFGQADCGTETLSLQDDIQPIIAASCAVPGCHVSGAQPPDFTNKQNIIDKAIRVRTRTQNRTMPPPGSGITLTAEEINKINCWVTSGAPNN